MGLLARNWSYFVNNTFSGRKVLSHSQRLSGGLNKDVLHWSVGGQIYFDMLRGVWLLTNWDSLCCLFKFQHMLDVERKHRSCVKFGIIEGPITNGKPSWVRGKIDKIWMYSVSHSTHFTVNMFKQVASFTHVNYLG